MKAILKDLHNKIRALEQDLMEKHRRMAQDPEMGISVLLDKPVNPYSRDMRASGDDAATWIELIEKHKE